MFWFNKLVSIELSLSYRPSWPTQEFLCIILTNGLARNGLRHKPRKGFLDQFVNIFQTVIRSGCFAVFFLNYQKEIPIFALLDTRLTEGLLVRQWTSVTENWRKLLLVYLQLCSGLVLIMRKPHQWFTHKTTFLQIFISYFSTFHFVHLVL